VVKRFLQLRGGSAPRGSRHAPEAEGQVPRFVLTPRQAILPSAAEIAANPRARSAKLRLARRLDTPAGPVDAAALGLPARTLRELRS
jgi:16S rRNA (cytosine1402-N4)-methyltransferase